MKIRSIRIKNYRSITKPSTMDLSGSTILIGPNNEGKSNVLRGLVLSMNTLLGRPVHRRRRYGTEVGDDYDWERDFPVPEQPKHPNGESEFVLEFSLTADEEDAFYQAVGSRIKERLPIKVLIGKNPSPKVSLFKRGPGKGKLSSKKGAIAEFVQARFELEYIPAVRTAESAHRIVDVLAQGELRALEGDAEYQKALSKIAELQQPVLDALSVSIADTLRQFLPSLQSVSMGIPAERRYAALRNVEVHVDDGTRTELRFKGDGVQSLAALALMRHASKRNRQGKDVLVAIEEPESHLHPKAIHELHEVLKQLVPDQQVVLTTHCPLFVNRNDIKSNIIVEGGQARAAKSIAELRDTLGVRASDNLQAAELVLVVEGDEDRVALAALLQDASPVLRRALAANRLAIDPLGGASNLVYKLGLLRGAMCATYCFIDDDDPARKAIEKAKAAHVLDDADYTTTVCGGLDEAEFEDLVNTDLIDKIVSTSFSVMSTKVPSPCRKQKWSKRMVICFQAAGKPWNKPVQMKLKALIASAVADAPSGALAAGRRSVFDNLVTLLETRLSKKP